MGRRRFVLLDRDGTIIVERNYLSDPDGVELLPGTASGLRKLAALGLGLVVVSNQSGVGRGYFGAPEVEAVNQRMRDLLRAEGVELDAIYYCPHAPADACPCRKPKPGLIERAAREHGFVPREAFVIGDQPCDVELARGVGATAVLVRTGYGAGVERKEGCAPDLVADDLEAAARAIGRLLASNPPAM